MTIKDLKDKKLLLFECISGSKAHGLDTAQSDTDIKGVYYMPKKDFFGLKYLPQISNETNDEVYYEIGRFIELLIKNNPTALEILATPKNCILHKHPLMEKLSLDLFLSQLCKETFGGYAITQIKKARGLKKKMVNPVPKKRKTVIDFCFILEGYSAIKANVWLKEHQILQSQCGLAKIPNSKGIFALFYGREETLGYKGIALKESATEVSVSSIPLGEKEIAYLFFNQDSYSLYCKEHSEYWNWVENRNKERYAQNENHGRNYDSKNMMHTIRLLQMTLEIIRDGKLNIKRPNRDELLAIKNGEFEYDELLHKAEELIMKIEHESTSSLLKAVPDATIVEETLVEIRNELYA